MADWTPWTQRSPRLLVGLLLLVPAILAGWAFQSLSAAARMVETAEADLADCRQMAADIERLRHQPRIAALYEESPSEITERVSRAIAAASVPQAALVQVQPQAPVRVNRTQYMLRSTQVELDNVTMEQVVRFAAALEDASQGMIVRNLTLTEPQSSSSRDERWNAEVTLTQTIFSPTIR